jgi:hypothetical protein
VTRPEDEPAAADDALLDDRAHRHHGEVLGSATAPADDADSGGAEPGPASGAAGPSWPPAGTEPDAHRG